jgi:hypothetical protein
MLLLEIGCGTHDLAGSGSPATGYIVLLEVLALELPAAATTLLRGLPKQKIVDVHDQRGVLDAGSGVSGFTGRIRERLDAHELQARVAADCTLAIDQRESAIDQRESACARTRAYERDARLKAGPPRGAIANLRAAIGAAQPFVGLVCRRAVGRTRNCDQARTRGSIPCAAHSSGQPGMPCHLTATQRAGTTGGFCGPNGVVSRRSSGSRNHAPCCGLAADLGTPDHRTLGPSSGGPSRICVLSGHCVRVGEHADAAMQRSREREPILNGE